MARTLIVNADDFGQSDGINRGVIEAHERGIVTSASLMVRWPAAAGAAAYARAHRRLSLGLHLDLCEWVCHDATWSSVYERVNPRDPDAVEREVREQLRRFIDLMGVTPTHLDSHQHVHRKEPVRSALLRVARELAVPLRDASPTIQYCGSFYGQTAGGIPLPDRVDAQALVTLLQGLPHGITELGCHPGYADGLTTMYVAQRTVEVRSLCDATVRAALTAGAINLISFHDLAPV